MLFYVRVIKTKAAAHSDSGACWAAMRGRNRTRRLNRPWAFPCSCWNLIVELLWNPFQSLHNPLRLPGCSKLCANRGDAKTADNGDRTADDDAACSLCPASRCELHDDLATSDRVLKPMCRFHQWRLDRIHSNLARAMQPLRRATEIAITRSKTS